MANKLHTHPNFLTSLERINKATSLHPIYLNLHFARLDVKPTRCSATSAVQLHLCTALSGHWYSVLPICIKPIIKNDFYTFHDNKKKVHESLMRF